MSNNNIYYVDMEKRFDDFQNGRINMRQLHPMIYEENNVTEYDLNTKTVLTSYRDTYFIAL